MSGWQFLTCAILSTASIVFARQRILTWVPGMSYVEDEPKSKKGRRKITLSRVVIEALKEHRARQDEARAKMDDLYGRS